MYMKLGLSTSSSSSPLPPPQHTYIIRQVILSKPLLWNTIFTYPFIILIPHSNALLTTPSLFLSLSLFMVEPSASGPAHRSSFYFHQWSLSGLPSVLFSPTLNICYNSNIHRPLYIHRHLVRIKDHEKAKWANLRLQL